MELNEGKKKSFKNPKLNIENTRNSWNTLPKSLWPKEVLEKKQNAEIEKKRKAREKFEYEKKMGINPIPKLDVINKDLHDKSAYDPKKHGDRKEGQNKVITGYGSKWGPAT